MNRTRRVLPLTAPTPIS